MIRPSGSTAAAWATALQTTNPSGSPLFDGAHLGVLAPPSSKGAVQWPTTLGRPLLMESTWAEATDPEPRKRAPATATPPNIRRDRRYMHSSPGPAACPHAGGPKGTKR